MIALSRFRFILLVSMLMLLVVACTPAEDTSDLPTLAVLPSATPSHTPTETPIPSETPIPTETPSPTNTPSHTPTRQPSNTPTSSVTPLPTNTPTSTLTLTPIVTNTLPPSATSAPTATVAPPVILSFSANASSVAPGAAVVLTWQVDADSARLERVNQAGIILETNPVPLTANISAIIPSGEPVVIYRLVGLRASLETAQSITINVAQTCSIPYFFGTGTADIGCPLLAAVQAPAVYQRFERGIMFRIQFDGLDRVCGIQNDRNRYSCFAYAVYTGTPSSTPPSGLQPPAAEVANVFYNQLAIGGFWPDIIGWGTTAPANAPLTTQRDAEGRIYIQLPVGIYRFDKNLTSGVFEKYR